MLRRRSSSSLSHVSDLRRTNSLDSDSGEESDPEADRRISERAAEHEERHREKRERDDALTEYANLATVYSEWEAAVTKKEAAQAAAEKEHATSSSPAGWPEPRLHGHGHGHGHVSPVPRTDSSGNLFRVAGSALKKVSHERRSTMDDGHPTEDDSAAFLRAKEEARLANEQLQKQASKQKHMEQQVLEAHYMQERAARRQERAADREARPAPPRPPRMALATASPG